MKVFHFIGMVGLLLALIIGLSHASPINDTKSTNRTDTLFVGPNDSLNLATRGKYDPSLEHQSSASVEVWLGKAKSTVGQVLGAQLYRQVHEQLTGACPSNPKDHQGQYQCDVKDNGLGFWTKCRKADGSVGACWTSIHDVKGRWIKDDFRQILINATASTLSALTNAKGNCFELEGEKTCMIGDVVRINMPDFLDSQIAYSNQNQMHIYITNDDAKHMGDWNCCGSRSRQKGDEAIDILREDVLKAGTADWYSMYRDVRCIIKGTKICPR